jgi:hypothetical protein
MFAPHAAYQDISALGRSTSASNHDGDALRGEGVERYVQEVQLARIRQALVRRNPNHLKRGRA